MDAGTEPEPRVGLRERKAAATRLALAEALAARIATRLVSEVTVDEVAAAAGVSRMTFFNHFPTKEHALEHLFCAALYRAQCARRDRGLRGVGAIVHLFESFGAWTAASPMCWRQVVAWFAARPHARPDPRLDAADRALLSPTQAREPLRHARDFLPELVAEARRLDGLGVAGSDYEVAHMLGALLIGGAVVGHSRADQDWRALYRHHAARALGLEPPAGRDPRDRARGTETAPKRRRPPAKKPGAGGKRR